MNLSRISSALQFELRHQQDRFFGKKMMQNSIHAAPDFMVIGAAKSGTTSLFQYLAQHSDIIAPQEKELKYFGMGRQSKGLNNYLENFPLKVDKGNKITFEASPTYLHIKKSPKHIVQLFPNMKFIAILRDPVKRAFSHWNGRHSGYLINKNAHLGESRSFEEAVYQELNEIDKVPMTFRYLEKGKYAEQIKEWYKYFSPQQICLLDFQDLKVDLKGLLKEMTDFLEIPFSYNEFNEADQSLSGHIFTKDQTNEKELKRYNVTSYSQKLDAKIETELRTYFQPFDDELLKLVNKKFSWMK